MVQCYENNMSKIAVIVLLVLFTSTFKTVVCQCFRGFKILTATTDYQELTSPGYPVYYSNSRSCSWIFYAVNDTYAIKFEVIDSSIEYDSLCSLDYGEVFDGNTVLYSPSLGKFCGTQTPTYISTNNSMVLIFVTDASNSYAGFKARYKSGPRDSLLAGVEEDDGGSFSLSLILGTTLGCLAFVILLSVVFVLVYKYMQAKKTVQVRPRSQTHRPISSVRVRPCGSGENQDSNAELPPSYDKIHGAALPGYSADNSYPHSSAASIPQHMDSNLNNWNSKNEKAPLEKKPLDD